MGRKVAVAMTALFVATLLSASASAGPPVYRYIDARGVVHFSNVPNDSRYRAIDVRRKGADLSPKPRKKPPVNHGYDSLILRQARANRLDPALVKAVIAAESNFSPAAVSHAGAQGLMQLMPRTARGLGVTKPLEASDNVKGGSRYLREMLDRYGDLSRALAAYNAGPAAVDLHRGIPPYPETKAYVKRVLAYYRGYRGDFQR